MKLCKYHDEEAWLRIKGKPEIPTVLMTERNIIYNEMQSASQGTAKLRAGVEALAIEAVEPVVLQWI